MTPELFDHRRRQLMSMTGESAIVVVPAAPVRLRNRDTAYPYRQSSDFYYLTGFAEPDAVLVLVPGREAGAVLLFCRDRDPEQERWDGPRAGLEGARERYGMDDAFPIEDIDEILPNLIEGRSRVYHTLGQDHEFDLRLMGWVNHVRSHVPRGGHAPGEFISLDHPLHELRLIKGREEIAALGRSARLAVAGHRRAMRACRPGMTEYALAAELVHEFALGGAVPSYAPIVGGGPNACILHYVANEAVLRDGDLVLIDAGAELDYYASDITRTFPVNGRFDGPQRAIYEIVLAAQAAAIDAVRPGAPWDACHTAAAQVVAAGLCDLELLGGPVEDALEAGTYRRFFPHKTGHWLGMDVHDVGDYRVDGHSRELEKNMVLTVEPGIYIPPGSGVDARFEGIGVRIEDDVVVTSDGHRVLSGDAPKAIDEVEAWMRS